MNILEAPSAWEVEDLKSTDDWCFEIDESDGILLRDSIKSLFEQDRDLFSYSPNEFNFGSSWEHIEKAVAEAHHGKGISIVRGLPREDLSQDEFRLLSWAIGLKAGVARPQGLAAQYISAVQDVGTDYRAANGRGYSSNAELDFHVDVADLTILTCYNKAKSGGQSMITLTS